jgi:hypothetical protein
VRSSRAAAQAGEPTLAWAPWGCLGLCLGIGIGLALASALASALAFAADLVVVAVVALASALAFVAALAALAIDGWMASEWKIGPSAAAKMAVCI